jgi:ABC-type transporter Mla maintaining outer membrane lipid asymmetry ATPase subunit MlaF
VVGDEFPDQAYIQVGEHRFKMAKKAKNAFEFQLENLRNTTEIRFSANGFQSIPTTIEVLPKPIVAGFDVWLDYPTYLGRTDERISNAGELEVPAGTTVRWSINTQKVDEIGFLFQGSALFDGMTVEENVGFPLKMFTDKNPAQIKERVDFVIQRVNLIDANHKKPSEISGGMQKRVAIARAIVNNPKYLFCDEPNSGLDPKTAILIDNLIHEITEEYNITTVINTHDMNSVMEIGQKIVFIKEGVLAWEGTKKDIFKTDNEAIVDFVYSSNLFKKIRKAQNKEL